jgi:hypothetical protein
MWLFEFCAPLFELMGYSSMIVALSLGLLGRQFFILFLIFGYGIYQYLRGDLRWREMKRTGISAPPVPTV